MPLDIHQHLFSHESFFIYKCIFSFCFIFCMCIVEGIRVLCACERGRVYSLGMGEKVNILCTNNMGQRCKHDYE